MKRNSIVLLIRVIGIIIGLIGIVLFINHLIDENFIYSINGYNTVDFGNNNISITDSKNYSFAMGENETAEGKIYCQGISGRMYNCTENK